MTSVSDCYGAPSAASVAHRAAERHAHFSTGPAHRAASPNGKNHCGAEPAGPAASDRVIVVDANAQSRTRLCEFLRGAGFEALPIADAGEFVEVDADSISAAIVNLQDASEGAEACSRLRARCPELAVIVILGSGQDAAANDLDQDGDLDCLRRPVHPEVLLGRLRVARQLTCSRRECRDLRNAFCWPAGEIAFVANSQLGMSTKHQMESFASLDSTVMIVGRSGTGRTTVARWLHAFSRRAAGPLVAVQCDRVPRDLIDLELFGQAPCGDAAVGLEPPRAPRIGRLELADGGTLLLEEIGALPLAVQARLADVLQTRQVLSAGRSRRRGVDFRLIATSTEDPAELSRRGVLLEALRYRLNVLTMRLPTLAERREDVVGLFEHLLDEMARRQQLARPVIAASAHQVLLEHNWPGNIHELVALAAETLRVHGGELVDRAALAGLLAREKDRHSSADGKTNRFVGQTMAEIERAVIVETLHACGGNKAKTARQLGLSEKTIYNKIRHYGLRAG